VSTTKEVCIIPDPTREDLRALPPVVGKVRGVVPVVHPGQLDAPAVRLVVPGHRGVVIVPVVCRDHLVCGECRPVEIPDVILDPVEADRDREHPAGLVSSLDGEFVQVGRLVGVAGSLVGPVREVWRTVYLDTLWAVVFGFGGDPPDDHSPVVVRVVPEDVGIPERIAVGRNDGVVPVFRGGPTVVGTVGHALVLFGFVLVVASVVETRLLASNLAVSFVSTTPLPDHCSTPSSTGSLVPSSVQVTRFSLTA
jgi:hypothetical protein